MKSPSATHGPNTTPRAAKWHGTLVYWVVALALFFVVAVLHFWRLGSAPKGLYVDEASIAYNAYCIAETGADEYGVKYPVFFRCLDDYQDPVLVYCLAPLVKVFGLTAGIARLPGVLFHLLGALAFGFLVQEYCRNKWLSLLGGALFACIPWVFPLSRAVYGDTAMLWGMVMGWWLLLMALRKRSYSLAAAAGIAWAFAMYARNIGRPMTALTLLCFALAFNRLLLAHWKAGLAFAMSYVTALLPMIISVVRFPQSLTARFERIGVFHGQLSIKEILPSVASRYLEYFSPRFLFLSGDQNLRHNTGWGGELFLFLIPLVLAGLYYLLRSFRNQPHYRLLTLSLLVYPLAAVLTIDRMHGGRSVNGAIPWLLTAMVGAQWLWQEGGLWRKLFLVSVCAGIMETTLYLNDYFTSYQIRSNAAFQTSFTDALKYCFGYIRSNETFYVEGSIGAPRNVPLTVELKPFYYAYFLFYGRINPRSYQQGGLSNTVIQPYLGQIHQPGLFLRCNFTPLLQEGAHFLAVPNPQPVPDSAKLLAVFPDNGPLEYQVYKVK